MINKPKVNTLTEAKKLHRFICQGCNWEVSIASQTDDNIKCCPWCGWSDNDAIDTKGAFQRIECEKHGEVIVSIISEGIEEEDFLDNFYCPFCK